jgi:hypothetical protein
LGEGYSGGSGRVLDEGTAAYYSVIVKTITLRSRMEYFDIFLKSMRKFKLQKEDVVPAGGNYKK